MSKFKVGDVVKVIRSGWGTSGITGETCTITGVDENAYSTDDHGTVGYLTDKFKNSGFGGYIGEHSFELVEVASLYKKVEKPFSEVPIGDVVYRHRYNILCVKLSQSSAARLANNSIGGICTPKDTEQITHIEGLTYADIYASIKEIAGIE